MDRPDDSSNSSEPFLCVNDPPPGPSGPTPLDIAKATIPDIFALARILEWPVESGGLQYAWYRENTNTPALSIREDGVVWYDFGLAVGGGVIDLLARVEGLDRGDACRRFIELSVEAQQNMTPEEIAQTYERAGGRGTSPERDQYVNKEKEREAAERRARWATMSPMHPLGEEDIENILRIRGWPTSAWQGLQHAAQRDLLFRSNRLGHPVFVVTDSARLSAKERRLDGCEIFPGRKATCLPGSIANWPLGTAEIRAGDRIFLVEGEADQLALFALLAIFAPSALGSTTVISLSASSRINERAMAMIKKRARHVTVIADEDQAGEAAVRRWTEQLASDGVPVRTVSVKGVTDRIKDISDLLARLHQFPDLTSRLRIWVEVLVDSEAEKPDPR
jgi:5S rRNA maturation endonuclease (ribonuclease M5)